MTAQTLPQLYAHTQPVTGAVKPLAYLDRSDSMLWWRKGQGMVARGCALRLDYAGPDRITTAAADWRRILTTAQISDPLRKVGTGLVAFGTFTFSRTSTVASSLIVPRTIVGRRDGTTWVTRIWQEGEPPPAFGEPEPAEPLGQEVRIHFSPGVMGPERYEDAIREGLARIQADEELHKLVLARDVHAHFPVDADLRPIIRSLALTYPDCWTFAVDGLLGASPETLVAVTSGVASSRVLAGSAARGADREADDDAAITLASSHKELDEHELAVRTVAASFRDFATGVTASDYPFALKLPNLWHLASEVGGRLRENMTALDAVAALHPTGAVAGSPRRAAARILTEIEGFDRGRYAGPVGWIGSTGDSEWAVALRCAQVEVSGDVTAWAGCGIVPESIPGKELEETRLKLRPIKDAFA